jgi:hypothetical protein
MGAPLWRLTFTVLCTTPGELWWASAGFDKGVLVRAREGKLLGLHGFVEIPDEFESEWFAFRQPELPLDTFGRLD